MAFVLMIANIRCKEEYNDDTFSGSKVMILGHRGMGELYTQPGNTLQAISPVLAIGADGCEIDVQLTKDTVLVLYHDKQLDGRTNCEGHVYEKNWSDLCLCEYNAFENDIYVNSVDAVFRAIPNLQQFYFSFDLSKVDYDALPYDVYRDQYLRAVKRVCEQYHMSSHVFLEGDAGLLIRAKELGLTNKMFLFGYLNEDAVQSCTDNGFAGISTTPDWISTSVDMAHEAGLYVMIWSPNNESQNKDALKSGADIIQTDDPISILKLLNRYNYEYVIP